MAKELRGISPAVHQVIGIQTSVPAVGPLVTCEPTLAPHDYSLGTPGNHFTDNHLWTRGPL